MRRVMVTVMITVMVTVMVAVMVTVMVALGLGHHSRRSIYLKVFMINQCQQPSDVPTVIRRGNEPRWPLMDNQTELYTSMLTGSPHI